MLSLFFFFLLQACDPSRYPCTGLCLCAETMRRDQLSVQDISSCLLDLMSAVLCY